ncbi:MAG: type IV toxin-antitoxin system AbiEi family antitoxin domain-containing protein [Bdellovibrionales bacterium]|nr:type IV toxin-antitoxin system AbiEi family antitoxin domain-containing protein [Bdellovibrionales bacterium]MCB0414465.1 type IV toxin-antitoxin system AbiEi family antitoxin domain-containing protein [Bdellovibrionales bacterium]
MELKYNNPELSGLSRKERDILTQLSKTGKLVFSANDIEDVANVGRARANLILSRLSSKGWLQRLLPGTYRIVPIESDSSDPVVEDSWALATELFNPCYISGWSAAEHWGLTDQIFDSLVVFTATKQKASSKIIGGVKFRIRQINQNRIFGTKTIWEKSSKIFVADIHKTLIDILELPSIGGGGRHVLDIAKAYWRSKEADSSILLKYAKKVGKGSVFKRLGLVAESFGKVDKDWLMECKARSSSGIIKFDPNGPAKGRIITKWGIRINVPESDLK